MALHRAILITQRQRNAFVLPIHLQRTEIDARIKFPQAIGALFPRIHKLPVDPA